MDINFQRIKKITIDLVREIELTLRKNVPIINYPWDLCFSGFWKMISIICGLLVLLLDFVPTVCWRCSSFFVEVIFD